MPDIQVGRETYIMVSDGGPALYPDPNLYPDPDLYPQNATRIGNIVEGSMSLDELLCDGELKFGQLCATKFEVTVYDTDDIGGKYLSVYQEDDGVYHQVFTGVVDSAKLDRLGTDRQVVAYDYAYTKSRMNVASWWDTFWSTHTTATLKQLRESLLNYADVIFENVTLINDSAPLSKTIDVSSISFAEMLRMVCELSCCFPHFNRDGEMEFVMLDTSSTAISLETLYEGDNSTFQDYTTQAFTGIQFYGNSSDLQYIEGTSVNPYNVQENILLYGATTQLLHAIGDDMLDYISTITYKPSSVQMIISDWTYKLGDRLSTTKGSFYVLHQYFDGMQLIEQLIEQQGTETQQEVPIETRVADVLDKADKVEIEEAVDTLDDDINNPVTGVKVTFQQNLDSLEATVAGTTEIWDETNYNISVYGYDTPDNEGYTPSSYTNQYYLNQTTGYVYQSNGSAWNYVAALTKIQAALQSQITQNAGQISLKVSKGNVSSEISQEAGQITLSAGRLVINSGNFTLDSSGNATATNFYAKETLRLANTAGTYTVYLKATSAYRTGYPMLAIRDSNDNLADLNCDQIRANSVYSGGRTVITAGNIGSQSVSYANTAGSANSVSWSNVSGKPTIPTDYLTGVSSGGRESGTGKYFLHTLTKSGSNVQYTTMEIDTSSDRRLKVDIEKLDDFTDLYMDLEVYKFKYNPKLKATRMRDYVHYGIMAQDTMALYEKYGISSEKIALFYKESCDEVQEELTGEETYWSMNKDSLHALHIQMIQKQQKKIDNLELEVSELKAKLKEVVNAG